MSETLLNRLLNEEIEVGKCVEWLKTGHDESSEFPCTRAEFVIYFTNYLRNQTECVLRSTSSIASDPLVQDSKAILTESQTVPALKTDDISTGCDSANTPIKNSIQNVHQTNDDKKRVNTRLFHEETNQNSQPNFEAYRFYQNSQTPISVSFLTPKRDDSNKSFALSNLEVTPNNSSGMSDRRYAVSTPLKPPNGNTSLNRNLFETPIKGSPPMNLFSPINTNANEVMMLNTSNYYKNAPYSPQYMEDPSAPLHMHYMPTDIRNQNHCPQYMGNPSPTIQMHYKPTDVPNQSHCPQYMGNPSAALQIHYKPTDVPEQNHCPQYMENPSAALQMHYMSTDVRNQSHRRPNDFVGIHGSPNNTMSDASFDNRALITRQNISGDVSNISSVRGHTVNGSFNKSTRGRPNVYVADFINSAGQNAPASSNNLQGGKKKRHVKYINMSLDEELMTKKTFKTDKTIPSNEKLNIQYSEMFPEIGTKRRDARQSNRSNTRRINPTRLNCTNPDSDHSLKSLESSSLSSRSNSRLDTTEFGVKYHEKIEQNEAFKSVHNFKAPEHATNFHEERSILKAERERVMDKFSLINNTRSEKMPKMQAPLTISKHVTNVKVEITFVTPDLAKVLDVKMLNILADVYDAMLNYNLIMNVTSEIYFLISLIVSQQVINAGNESVKDADKSTVESSNNQLREVQKSFENIEITEVVDEIELDHKTKDLECILSQCKGNDLASGISTKFRPLENHNDDFSKMLPLKPMLHDKNPLVGCISEENHENINIPVTENQIKTSLSFESGNVDMLSGDKENIDLNTISSENVLNTKHKPIMRILKRSPNKMQAVLEKNISATKINESQITSVTALKDEGSSKHSVLNTAVAVESSNPLLPAGKLLKSVHDCVYFALATLYKQKSSLSVFLDKNCLRILLQNDRVNQFLPSFVDVLSAMQTASVLFNEEESGFSVSEISNKNVCFFTETDSVDNFPTQQNFFAFKKQRDMFYEIFRLWESQHASLGNFAYKMERQVSSLLSLGYSPANMLHLARLFRDQLLATCATTHKENSLEALAKLQSAIGSQQLSHNRLSKLSERLTGALPGQKSETGIFQQPTFEKEQVFFRDFIVYTVGSNFRVHLIDALIQGIIKLDRTAFPCLERENNGTQVDAEMKNQYLQCVKSLQILGKFLGFAMALPYCERPISSKPGESTADSNVPTEKFLNGEIAVRSWTQPPINLTGILCKSLKDSRLILTVPWLLQVVAMLDYASLRLPYFKTLLNQLFHIYVTHLMMKPHGKLNKKTSSNKQMDAKTKNTSKNDLIVNKNHCMSENIRLVLKISFGWLFDLPKFPKEMFYDYLCETSVIHNIDGNRSGIVIYGLSNETVKHNKSVKDVTSKKKSIDNAINKDILSTDVSNDKTDQKLHSNCVLQDASASCETENTTKDLIVQINENKTDNSLVKLNTMPKSKTSKESDNSEIINSNSIMDCGTMPQEVSEEIEAFASLDCLDLVDKDVLSELCPYLRHLRNLLSSGVANKISGADDNTNTFRHITPVTSGLDGQAAKRKEAELQSQLEEWFLRSQPSGTRRITQLVSERVGSALTGMASNQLPAHRERVSKEAHLLIITMSDAENTEKTNMTSLCAAVSRLREEKSKAFVKRCLRAATILAKSRCRSALVGLLPHDIPETAAKQLVHICTRRACSVFKRALNNQVIYTTEVQNEVKRFCRIGLRKREIKEMKEECLEAERMLNEIEKGVPATPATEGETSAMPLEFKMSPSTMTYQDYEGKTPVNFDDWFKSAFDAIIELKDVVIAIISGDLEQSEESKRVKNAIESASTCSQCSYVSLVTKKTIAQLCLDLAVMIISTHPATLKGFFDALKTIWKNCLHSGNTEESSCIQQSKDFTPEDMTQFTALVCGVAKKSDRKKTDDFDKSDSSPEKKVSISLRAGKNARNIKAEKVLAKDESILQGNTVTCQDEMKSEENYLASSIDGRLSNREGEESIADRRLTDADNSMKNDDTQVTKDERISGNEDLPVCDGEFFDTLLCTRNLAILSSSACGLLVWETLSDFLIFLLDNKFLREDSLTEQCLALYRQDWPQNVLQNLAHCIKLVSEKRRPSSSDSRFNLFLQFLSEFCHNLDQEYF